MTAPMHDLASVAAEGWSVADRKGEEEGAPAHTEQKLYVGPGRHGAQVRHAYVLAGDCLAVIIHERKGGAAAVPFHQSVAEQTALLG
ncbi:hypothetical protein [Streptomyces tsukubensis]|uniref:Uncharacterized protein n=1 Tax=Streptomyces tsukubensis TaxID=83656 RepID=A0A1V4A8V2_9ACTN|nr:hypothetical protein [Streptomyces tsukubensis]OON78847.1 hypothetical protein B1H18_15940 [Streptomyces tsukubensis]QFR94324.1 hypothetical protein GBW32_16265 [Streptomyces tsukubensis]